jgi:hypothetical protein
LITETQKIAADCQTNFDPAELEDRVQVTTHHTGEESDMSQLDFIMQGTNKFGLNSRDF